MSRYKQRPCDFAYLLKVFHKVFTVPNNPIGLNDDRCARARLRRLRTSRVRTSLGAFVQSNSSPTKINNATMAMIRRTISISLIARRYASAVCCRRVSVRFFVSVRPCVCHSVQHTPVIGYCVKRARLRLTKIMLHNSSGTL